MKILYIYTILFFVCLNWINCVVIPCYFRKIDECKGLFFFQQIVLYYSVLKKHWKLFHQNEISYQYSVKNTVGLNFNTCHDGYTKGIYYRLYTWTLLFLINVIVSSDNSHCGKYYNISFHTFLTLFTMVEIL